MGFATLITMLVFVLFLNFAVIRPHKMERKRFASMLASIGEGSVVYAAGIRGTVLEVRQDSILMVTGPLHVPLEIDKSAIEAVESANTHGELVRNPRAGAQKPLDFLAETNRK